MKARRVDSPRLCVSVGWDSWPAYFVSLKIKSTSAFTRTGTGVAS